MASRPASIRQTDVTRLVKGVLNAGFEIGKVEVEGAKVVIFGRDATAMEAETPLRKWRREDGQS